MTGRWRSGPSAASNPLDAARREHERHIQSGGIVVADTAEVREAMFAAFRAKRDGVEMTGPARTRWRWREQTLR